MKKITTAAIILTSFFTVGSIAFAAPNNSTRPMNHNGQQGKRDLNLTQQDAKILVQAALIKHNKSNLSIQKINEIDLAGGKKFYLVYVSEPSQSAIDSFLIVDAQNGCIMPFPKPKHGKHHRHNNHQQQNNAINFQNNR